MKTFKEYTILYAEDEENIRRSYASFLSNLFKKVYEAADGAQALRLYREERPDILLSDILLPKTDGLSLVEKIRREDDRTRVIMMTAYSDRERLLKATELNITKYLIKPIRRSDLVEALETASSQLKKLDPPLLKLADSYIFDKKALVLTYKGRTLGLSKSERLFVSLLVQHPGEYLSIQRISELFYINYDKDLSTDALKSLIKRFRKKLPSELIENRFGTGYRLIF